MAVKKHTGHPLGLMGKELKKFLDAVEQEERSSIVLGETSGPLLDIYETADDIVVEVDVPGMDADDLEVCILHGILTVEGIKREKIEEHGRINYLCMERSFDPFKRIIKISVPINPKLARANYTNGVLTVSFPKVKEQRGEPILIKVEKG